MINKAGGLDKLNVPVNFYGRVVDQSGAPVSDAEVSITFFAYAINEAGLSMSDKILKSDSNGLFVFNQAKGKELIVNAIKRKGYEFPIHGGSPQGSSFEYTSVPRPFIPDQAHPVIFFGRKKGPTDCLLTRDVSIGFSPGDTRIHGDDLIRGAGLRFQPNEAITQLGGDPVEWDLKIQASFDATKRFWSLRLTPGGPDGGILISDKILYEAPVDGYKSSLVLGPNVPELTCRYIYLRTRRPAIYTRIDLGDPAAGRGLDVKKWPFVDDGHSQQKWNFYLDAEAVINPYGERNLENDTDLPFDVRHQIEVGIDTAFRHGNRPTKPDLAALVEMWKLDHPSKKKLFGN